MGVPYVRYLTAHNCLYTYVRGDRFRQERLVMHQAYLLQQQKMILLHHVIIISITVLLKLDTYCICTVLNIFHISS